MPGGSLFYPTFAESDTPALVQQAQQRYGAEHTCGFLPSAVIDPEGNTTHFTYNQGGDIVSVTDPLGRVTRADTIPGATLRAT